MSRGSTTGRQTKPAFGQFTVARPARRVRLALPMDCLPMDRRQFLALPAAAASPPPRFPNIVYFLADISDTGMPPT